MVTSSNKMKLVGWMLTTWILLFGAGFDYVAAVKSTGARAFTASSRPLPTKESAPPKPSAKRWLDEGTRFKAHLNDFGSQKTVCFNAQNATFRFRADPLNSSTQPLLLQAFAQSEEIELLYSTMVDSLQAMQNFLVPFRMGFYAWSDLRVVVQSPVMERMRVSYSRSPGMLCSLVVNQLVPWIQALVASEWLPPTVGNALETVVDVSNNLFCASCVKGCVQECIKLTEDSCVLVLSPFHSPCVTVTAPTKSLLSLATPPFTYSVLFYSVISWTFAQWFALGLVLYFASDRLARSRSFHYALGATIGVMFSAMLALYFVSRQTRASSKLVPGSQFVDAFRSLMGFVVPFTSVVLLPPFVRLCNYAVRLLWMFWSVDSLFGVPHIGKLYFVFFALLGCTLVWWNQWGANPNVHVESETPTSCVIDGTILLEEEQEIPMSLFQSRLASGLRLIGLAFLFYSTSCVETSLLLLLVVRSWRVFEFLRDIWFFWYHQEEAGKHSVMISGDEYATQGQLETAKALAQLQEYLQQNPEVIERVKEQSEIRLRRFAKGKDHLDSSEKEESQCGSANGTGQSWLLRRWFASMTPTPASTSPTTGDSTSKCTLQ